MASTTTATLSPEPEPEPEPRTATTAEFPRFCDGDVAVVLASTRVFHLHSSTLRPNSKLFARLLDPAHSTTVKNSPIKWRIELKLADHDAPPEQRGTLHLRMLHNNGLPYGASFIDEYKDLDAAQLPKDEFHHWENLLRCYYQLPAHIRSEMGIGSVLQDVVKLADLAEYCGSMRVVSLAIDNALLRQGQVLWQSVARSPSAWAGLGLRVRCEMVLRESIIHLVGMWPRLLQEASAEIAELATDGKKFDFRHGIGGMGPDSRSQAARNMIASLDPEIRSLCHKKHQVLYNVKKDIEHRILSHYPTHFHKNGYGAANQSQNVDPSNMPNVALGSKTVRGLGHAVKSAAYSGDIMGWMALCLYRHFVGQMIAQDMGCRGSDGGYAFYHALSRAGEAYLNRTATEEFVGMFPLSAKARAMFEEQLGIIKEQVRPYVADLVTDRLTLEKDAGRDAAMGIEYLKCAIVRHGDMPWILKRNAGSEEHAPWPEDESNVRGEHIVEQPEREVDSPTPRPETTSRVYPLRTRKAAPANDAGKIDWFGPVSAQKRGNGVVATNGASEYPAKKTRPAREAAGRRTFRNPDSDIDSDLDS